MWRGRALSRSALRGRGGGGDRAVRTFAVCARRRRRAVRQRRYKQGRQQEVRPVNKQYGLRGMSEAAGLGYFEEVAIGTIKGSIG